MAARMRCRVVAALGFAVIALAIGCRGASDSATATTPTTTPTTTTTATTATTTAVTPTEREVPGSAPTGGTAPAATGADRSEVRPLSITIEDPALGPLTFDALTAGDPQAASDGRLVVLLHGFPETAESYREILPALAREGYYAVAYSQRGYSPGARPAAIESYNIVAIVGDLLRIVDHLGARTFHVVGHDWGGGVAWAVAALQPGRVSTLTALSTPHPDALRRGISDPADPQHQASAYMDTFRATGSEDRLLVNGADSFRTIFGTGAGGLPAAKVDAYATVLATPPALRAALNWYRANPLDRIATLGPVQVPTLYLWGADDGAFTRGSAERTQALVTGRYTFVEVAGHGHWLPEDAADEVLASLIPHLAASGTSGTTGTTR